MLHQYFNPNAVKNYYASQKLEAHRFVRRLIDAPEGFMLHTRQCVLLPCFYDRFSSPLDHPSWEAQCSSSPRFLRSLTTLPLLSRPLRLTVLSSHSSQPPCSYFGSSVMRVTYGVEVDDEDEDYLGIAEDLMTRFSEVFIPGKYLVEAFPSLRHVFPPRVGFKRDAEELRLAALRMINIPWSATRVAMVSLTPSFSVLEGG